LSLSDVIDSVRLLLLFFSYTGAKDGKLMLVTELVSRTLRQFLDEHHVGYSSTQLKFTEPPVAFGEFLYMLSLSSREALPSCGLQSLLDQSARWSMAIDVANGLEYLHRQQPARVRWSVAHLS
jgi:hypothetical protein